MAVATWIDKLTTEGIRKDEKSMPNSQIDEDGARESPVIERCRAGCEVAALKANIDRPILRQTPFRPPPLNHHTTTGSTLIDSTIALSITMRLQNFSFVAKKRAEGMDNLATKQKRFPGRSHPAPGGSEVGSILVRPLPTCTTSVHPPPHQNAWWGGRHLFDLGAYKVLTNA
jgi:hypothetical protein